MKKDKLVNILFGFIVIVVIVLAGVYAFPKRVNNGDEKMPIASSMLDEKPSSSKGVIYDEKETHYQPVINRKNGEALQAAKEVNPEVKGWLEITGLGIYAPIVQAEDNSRYRTHDWKGEESEAGAYYFDSRCYIDYILDLSPNAIIFGADTTTEQENAEDNIRFSQLEKYLDKAFFEANDTVLLTLSDYEIQYELIGAGYIEGNPDELLMKANPTPEEFTQVLDIVRSTDIHKTEFSSEGMTNIITLYAYSTDNGQAIAVFGKLVL